MSGLNLRPERSQQKAESTQTKYPFNAGRYCGHVQASLLFFELFVEHEEATDKTGIDLACSGEIDDDVFFRRCCSFEVGSDLCKISVVGGTGYSKQEQIPCLMPVDPDLIGVSLPQLVPSHEDQEGDDLGQDHLQQDGAVAQITAPELRFFLDAPKPLEAPILHPNGRPPACARLEIDCRAELGADRDLQAVTVFLQPQMRLWRT